MTDPPLVLAGRGHVGRSLARAAERAGLNVSLVPASDATEAGSGARAVLLCVPDEAIPEACATLGAADRMPGLVGHVSGATPLAALESARERGAAVFSIHPLQTFASGETPTDGTPAAVTGSDAGALGFATALAEQLGMRPFELSDADRPAYHAAASVASNFLVALQEAAAELLATAGVEDARELLAPLVLRTAANWAEHGGASLTGPIARGDTATVELHRATISARAPHLLTLYDVLAERTAAVAATPAGAST